MKTYRLISRIMATILLGCCFPSCISEVEEFFVQDGTIRLTSEITSTSRVTDQSLQSTRIVEGQQVGVTITGAASDHDNVAWVVGKNGSLSNTGSAVYWGTTNATITAYHPYHSSWTGTNHTFTVSTDQSTDKGYLNSDLLWATTTASVATNPVTLNFTHKLSKINVTLVNKGNENISNATITLCGVNVATGFNPQTGELYAVTEDIADIKASVTTESAYTASAIIVPQKLAQGTNFIKITFEDKDYHYTLPEDQVFESGQAYQFTIEVNISDNSNAKTDYVDLKFGMPGVSASYNSATGSLTMTYPSGSMPRVKEGKTIVLPADYGFDIRVIESYSVSGNNLIMKTSKGNMGNLFRNTSFTLTTDADVASRSANTNVYTPVAYGYVDEKGIYHEVFNESRAVYPIEQFNWEFKKDYNGKILYEGKAGTLKWDKCEFSAGVKGTFTFDFGEKTISEVRKVGDLRRMDYKLTGNVDMDMLLHYNYKYEYEESGDEIIEYNAIPMMQMTFRPIIAGVPVPIHLQIYTHLGKMYACQIEGEVDATAGVKAGNEITVGLEWTPEGGAKPIKEAKPYFEFYPLTVKAQASAEAKVSYYPQWEIGIYGFKAIWLEPRPYLKEKVGAGFRASTDGENYIGWKAETYNGMDLRMGLETDFGFWRKDIWTSDIYNIVKDQLLFEAPSRITTLSPDNNIVVEKGESVDAEFLVESFSPITNKYYPCPWALINFEPESGELDKPLAVTDLEGKAIVNWTPSPSVESRSSDLVECTLTAKVVDKEGASIDEASLVVKTEKEDELREALIKLYKSTNGDNWTHNDNWCSDKPITEWYGITKKEDNQYTLTFENNNLTGGIDQTFPEGISVDLICYNNHLTLVDLSGCSSIRYLGCYEPDLTTVDLSDCNALESLNLQRCKQLNNLDASNCKKMKYLNCSLTSLTKLNIQNSNALVNLECSYAKLTDLNLSPLKELTYLSCSSNQLTKLDVSHNSKLEYLYCGGNNLTSLDVSKCTELSNLNCQANPIKTLEISNHTALKELNCMEIKNGFTLNLNGCTALQSLHAWYCEFSTLTIKDCPSLTYSDIGQMKANSVEISGCTSLEGLSLSGEGISSLTISDCSSLTSLGSEKLGSLKVSNCASLASLGISDSDMSSLDLFDCTSLALLSLSNCNMSSLDLSDYTSLASLSLSNCNMSSLDLSNLTSLNTLEVNSSSISSLNVSGCTSLPYLYILNQSHVNSLDASNCSSLSRLDCYGVNLSSLNVEGCTSLSHLDCRNNKINSVIPDWFSQITEFYHDQKYRYWKSWSDLIDDYVTHHEANTYGWWYPGEPGKGKHSPD